MEEGVVTQAETGTPQGAVISPLLANVYLHYVFDLWAQQWRHRHARGNMIVVRYADDSVVGFERLDDAERFLAEMRARMEQFGLSVHPQKTRLIEFGRHAARRRAERGLGKPETFNFLGFTHICGRTRRGAFALKRMTRRDRMQAALRRIKEQLHRNPASRDPATRCEAAAGGAGVLRVPRGAHQRPALSSFRHHVSGPGCGRCGGAVRRTRSHGTASHGSPNIGCRSPRILHPWPERRFAVNHPRWEPGA